MSDKTVTITLAVEQVPVLNDVLYEALHSKDADWQEVAAYRALCDDVKRQLQEQRGDDDESSPDDKVDEIREPWGPAPWQ